MKNPLVLFKHNDQNLVVQGRSAQSDGAAVLPSHLGLILYSGLILLLFSGYTLQGLTIIPGAGSRQGLMVKKVGVKQTPDGNNVLVAFTVIHNLKALDHCLLSLTRDVEKKRAPHHVVFKDEMTVMAPRVPLLIKDEQTIKLENRGNTLC